MAFGKELAMKRFGVLLFLLHVPFSANAVSDMRNGNFSDTWTDFNVPGSGYDLRMRRTYNSRTLFNGILGFGWCTDFETKLESTPEGTLRVTECGGGLKLTFAPKGYNPSRMGKTIDTILAEVKKRNPTLKADYLNSLKEKLEKNDYLREEFGRQLKLKGEIKAGATYFADGRDNENIVLKDKTYIRTLGDGTNQRFDLEGRLTHMYDRNGNYLKMVYEKDKLTAIIDNNGRRLSLTYNPANNKVSKIVGPNNLSATYKYSEEDLIEVTNGWKNTFKYKYDDLHNLVRIDFPDSSFKALTYNKDKDWVMSFTNRKGCIENYNYQENPKDPLNHYWSTVEKKCGGKVTNKSRYEFFHKLAANGSRYLYRAVSDNNGDKTDIIYHPIFGKPTSVVRNSIKVTYDYYETGMVKAKNEDARLTTFNYKNACKKVSDITVKYFALRANPKTKKPEKYMARSVKTQFNYDQPKCNLIAASNSEGQAVTIAYDHRGRIERITDQAKKVVNIKYEERFGKPEFVTRPGLGTIRVKYKTDGEIDNVESKEGPLVAVQVASIFNNLLDLIAPATSEVSL